MNKIAKNLERFRVGVNSHNRENPTHSPAHGIGVSFFDLERLGFDEGEELWSGVCIYNDGGQSATFRVLCDGIHSGEEVAEEAEITKAVGANV